MRLFRRICGCNRRSISSLPHSTPTPPSALPQGPQTRGSVFELLSPGMIAGSLDTPHEVSVGLAQKSRI